MNAEKSNYQTTIDLLEQIKHAFEQNNSLVNLVFERMPIGICITNTDREFVNVNQAYCQLYGYEKEELLGNPFTMIVPSEGRQKMAKLHDDFMDKKAELHGEWEVEDCNHHKFVVLSNAAYIQDEETKAPLKMTFVVKLTDEVIACNQLEVTIKVLENKIKAQESAMSLTEHDIRKNLGTMVMVADILLKRNFSEQEIKWLKIIKNTGYDTLDLLKATEDYIKMENGNYTLEKEPFDLLQLLRGMVKSFKDHISSKKSTVTLYFNGEKIDFKTQAYWIDADLFYLKRGLKNLITNALDATPKEKEIFISVNTGHPFTITIHNEGVIPKDIRENFFEKYITSGKSTGTGLGTYIAKLIAKVHGGDLTFETSEEKGTSLIFSLPGMMETTKRPKPKKEKSKTKNLNHIHE